MVAQTEEDYGTLACWGIIAEHAFQLFEEVYVCLHVFILLLLIREGSGFCLLKGFRR